MDRPTTASALQLLGLEAALVSAPVSVNAPSTIWIGSVTAIAQTMIKRPEPMPRSAVP